MEPVRLGRILVAVGIAGVVAAVAAGVAGLWVVKSMGGTAEQSLALAGSTLDSVSASIVVAESALDTASEGVTTAAVFVGDAAETLERTSVVTEDLTGVITSDIPTAIDSVRAGLEPLASTAALVDSIMQTLALIGIDYDPDVTLEQAILDVEALLEPIATKLREQQEPLELLASDLKSFAGEAEVAASQLDSLNDSIAETQLLVEEYQTQVEEASVLVDEALDDLSWQTTLATIFAIAVPLALVASQAAPIGLGLHLRRTGAQDEKV